MEAPPSAASRHLFAGVVELVACVALVALLQEAKKPVHERRALPQAPAMFDQVSAAGHHNFSEEAIAAGGVVQPAMTARPPPFPECWLPLTSVGWACACPQPTSKRTELRKL